MNTKILRQYADPGLTIPANHGLLHAEQISYIVRTAVRTIDHHRTLILYVYDRKQALQGISHPTWTMFHYKSDYITLARDNSGKTNWRAACFENLERDYFFTSNCAFSSHQDEARVHRYFHSEYSGFLPLIRAQSLILTARQKKRQRQRDKKILARMRPLRALPSGLESWVRRSVMPAYFFYDYAPRKSVTGICSACGKTITLTNVKHNGKAVCPHCSRELTMKSRGRRGCIHDQDTCQVIQKVSEKEVVVRIIKVHYDYYNDEPKTNIYENARLFLRLDDAGEVRLDSYYYSYGPHELTPWKPGSRPVFYLYQNNFEADTCGHVYTGNLPRALTGTPWQYCPVKLFYEHFHERMQLVPFLDAHIVHPRFEHLTKVGFFKLATDLAYRSYDTGALDETQNRTHRILRVQPEDVAFLRELEVGLPTLRTYQKHCGENLKGRQELFRWAKENEVVRDIDKILPNMTVHKLLRYMDRQYSFLRLRKTPYGSIRYKDMQALVSEYRDYLEMCSRENYNLKNDFVLFPKDLQKSHDQLAGRIKHKADAKMRRKFKAVYQRVGSTLEYERSGMKIVCPVTPDDIVSEGHELHHCVGGYVHRVANGECLILFLRRCEDIAKSFYTIELRDRKIVQLKGMSNADATPEVQKFVDRWTHEVLQAQKAAA